LAFAAFLDGLFFVKRDYRLALKSRPLAFHHLPPHHLANLTLMFSRGLHIRFLAFPQKPGDKRRNALID